MKTSSLCALVLLAASTTYAQRSQRAYTAATDSTYGYTALNPLKMKQGDIGKSIGLSKVFLRNLRTADDQALQLLGRTSISDPAYMRPTIQLNNRYTRLPVSGKLGQLDVYVFKTAAGDTLRLFVDIYHKGPRLVPKGLKYVGL